MPSVFLFPIRNGHRYCPAFNVSSRAYHKMLTELKQRALHPYTELTNRMGRTGGAFRATEFERIGSSGLFAETSTIIYDAKALIAEFESNPSAFKGPAVACLDRFRAVY